MMKLLVIAALLALGGCAGSYTEPSLPAEHPASPAAEQSMPPTRWRTLDLAGADPVTPAPAGHGSGHSGTGHDLEPATEAEGHKHNAPAPPAAAAMYACPMHPEVTSDKPDQRCPECGMKLKPISAPAPGGPK